MTVFCHCRSCQKSGGGGYSLNLVVPTESLVIEGAPRSYEAVGTSGQPVTRRFCEQCGSPLFTEVAVIPGVSFVKGGSLDDPSWVKPTTHIWCDSAQPWDTIPEGATRIARNPG
jgi:hypothetical protein